MPWPFARTIPHDWKRKGFPALPPRGSFNTALHVILFRANAYLVRRQLPQQLFRIRKEPLQDLGRIMTLVENGDHHCVGR